MAAGGLFGFLKGKASDLVLTRGIYYNNQYEHSYKKFEFLANWLGSSNLATTANILSNSNDNFILRWYSDKLIRLPIKINTLEFDAIVDLPTL
jgi:hypothetical protein